MSTAALRQTDHSPNSHAHSPDSHAHSPIQRRFRTELSRGVSALANALPSFEQAMYTINTDGNQTTIKENKQTTIMQKKKKKEKEKKTKKKKKKKKKTKEEKEKEKEKGDHKRDSKRRHTRDSSSTISFSTNPMPPLPTHRNASFCRPRSSHSNYRSG